MEIIIIKLCLVIIFALAVIGKLTGKTKSTFENAGFSKEVMYATAIAEIIFTTMLFTRYDLFAALGLLFVTGGALFALFRQRAKLTKYVLAIIAAILLSVLLFFLCILQM